MEIWGGNRAADSAVAISGLDAWVYCKPFCSSADEPSDSGGDVYYVSSCATGRITRLLVADVSGHGAAVGSIADGLKHIMRKYVNYLDPTRFVSEMNRQFAPLSNSGNFATAVVTTYFAPNNHLTLCNAGHPPPLLYRAGQGWSFIESAAPRSGDVANLPLGIEDSSRYSQHEVKLRGTDMVLCYTDGLPESRNAQGEFLGSEGLLELLRQVDVSDPAKVVPSLLMAIEKLYPGNLTCDDITVLLFRPNRRGRGIVSFYRGLISPFRVGSAVIRSWLPGGGPTPWPDHHPANIGGAFIAPFSKWWKGASR